MRSALIEAARSLCIEIGFDAATTKQIAGRAGVNPAMIGYYFGSKDGLGREMMRVSMQPIIEQHEKLGAAASHGESTVAEFVRSYMTTLADNPWLPQLIVREVLPPNGRFRDVYFREFGAHSGRMLAGLRAQFDTSEESGAGIEPDLAVVSLASLVVFPYLAAPVLQEVLGIRSFDEATTERLITHTTALMNEVMGSQ